jgi:hypothetical protein
MREGRWGRSVQYSVISIQYSERELEEIAEYFPTEH